jgi:replicative superfamily II helicase
VDWLAEIQAFAAAVGFQPFEYQALGVEALLAGTDVLAIVPTGAGKSAVAQIVTGLRRKAGLGVTIAVEPIIALIDDQHRRAAALGLRAAKWNSRVGTKEKSSIINEISNDTLDILFTTPESLSNEGLYGALEGRVGLAWIDEGHVSISAKHFREFWSTVGFVVNRVKPKVRYACTATCTASAQGELVARCCLREPLVIRAAPERPNLSYQHIDRNADTVTNIIGKHAKEKVLVYVATRNQCERLSARLLAEGIKAGHYQGDMTQKERHAAQDGFGRGEFQAMVATDAFGLGIDYADIRALVTYDPADNISAWVQQAGRAGRDGKPATVYIASQCGADEGWKSRHFLVTSIFPPVEDIRRVWQFLRSKGQAGAGGSQIGIGKAAGLTKEYCAPQCFHWLKRKRLVRKVQDASDGRRFTYYATGDFERADFGDYHNEKPAAERALAELQRLWETPGPEIPKRICEYFEKGNAEAHTITNVRTPAKVTAAVGVPLTPATRKVIPADYGWACDRLAALAAAPEEVREDIRRRAVQLAYEMAAREALNPWNRTKSISPTFFMEFIPIAERQIMAEDGITPQRADDVIGGEGRACV